MYSGGSSIAKYWAILPIGIVGSIFEHFRLKRRHTADSLVTADRRGVAMIIAIVSVVLTVVLAPALVFYAMPPLLCLCGCVLLASLPVAGAKAERV